jgi:hypothetical protein
VVRSRAGALRVHEPHHSTQEGLHSLDCAGAAKILGECTYSVQTERTFAKPGSRRRLRKPCRNPGHLRYPCLHIARPWAACRGIGHEPNKPLVKNIHDGALDTLRVPAAKCEWPMSVRSRDFRRGVWQRRGCAVTGHSSKTGTRRDADPRRPLTACVGGLRYLCIEALGCRTRRVTNRITSPR